MKTNSDGVTTTTTDRATAEAVDNRYHRQVLAERTVRQQTPGERRPRLSVAPSERKQPGRKFGPPPKNPPHPRMQAPEPLAMAVRWEHYTEGGHYPMTARQRRQWDRLAARRGLAPRIGGKGHATPKRREASR